MSEEKKGPGERPEDHHDETAPSALPWVAVFIAMFVGLVVYGVVTR